MKTVVDEDICRGSPWPFTLPCSSSHTYTAAQIMSNISNIILHAPTPHEKNLEAAEGWARRAKDLIQQRKVGEGRKPRIETCETALSAILFNLGMLREVRWCFPSGQPRPFSLMRLLQNRCHQICRVHASCTQRV